MVRHTGDAPGPRSPPGPSRRGAAVTPKTFLITGISASGKSTVAQLLAQAVRRGPRGGDAFRRAIVSGRRDMSSPPSAEALAQLRLRYRLMAQTVDTYVDGGVVAMRRTSSSAPSCPTSSPCFTYGHWRWSCWRLRSMSSSGARRLSQVGVPRFHAARARHRIAHRHTTARLVDRPHPRKPQPKPLTRSSNGPIRKALV